MKRWVTMMVCMALLAAAFSMTGCETTTSVRTGHGYPPNSDNR